MIQISEQQAVDRATEARSQKVMFRVPSGTSKLTLLEICLPAVNLLRTRASVCPRLIMMCAQTLDTQQFISNYFKISMSSSFCKQSVVKRMMNR